MKKIKYIIVGFFLALSGCANNIDYNKEKEINDYKKFCDVDMDEIVPGNYIVNKVDQKYFYISSNNNIYSKNEIEKLKISKTENKDKISEQITEKMTTMVNGMIGFNVLPTKKTDNTNIENLKKIVVRKFSSNKNVNSIYCTSILSTEDEPEKYTTEKYKMIVKNKDYTNVDFYNNSERKHIFLIPLY